MKLRIKNLNWLAGSPTVILNDATAKKMNVFQNDRVCLKGSKKAYAIVDIFPKLVKKNEIGLSREISRILKLESDSKIEVSTSEISGANYLISKKINGEELNKEELEFIITEIVHNNITNAEIAYFTAAEKLSGMTTKEIVNLTKAMIKTGTKLKFKGTKIADKHSIGGIPGNRTTPIIISICAAAGLIMPKTSSRAITSAAGTADVMETVTNVELSIKEIKDVVRKTGACLAWGGSLGLAPSDDKIIKVERLLNLDIESQLIASIISKKVSAGSKYILIDVPYGKEAKVTSLKDAKNLGKKFKEISKYFNLKLKIIYTPGSSPIGNGIGPVLEMKDVIAVLKNSPEAPKDLKDKSLYLSTELLNLCGVKKPKEKAKEILYSGKAFEKFKEIVLAQSHKKDFERIEDSLKLGKFKKVYHAKMGGEIKLLRNNRINSLCRILGTPETISAGVYIHKKQGTVKRKEPLLTLYSESKSKMKEAQRFLRKFPPFRIR